MQKLWYFVHLMRNAADSLEKPLRLGKIEGRRRGRCQRMSGWMASLMQWTWTCTNFRRCLGIGSPGVLQSMGSQRVNCTTKKQPTLHKLNKQGNNIQLWCTPLSILNQSVVQRLVVTVASWPAHRFHRRQVKESGIPNSLRILHTLLWSTHSNDIKTVNKSEVVCFVSWNCLAFSRIQWILAIWLFVSLPF